MTLPTVTDATFSDSVERAEGVVAVDVGAEWCAPCRIVTPILEALAAELSGRVRVLSMDADSNPETMARFGIRNLPTVLLFRDGVLEDRIVGAMPRAAFQQRFEALSAG